jgi:hypothetical protein
MIRNFRVLEWDAGEEPRSSGGATITSMCEVRMIAEFKIISKIHG